MSHTPTRRSAGMPALALAGVLSLAACGGGGGGGSSPPDTSAGPSSISLSGVVSKGRMGNALVRVLTVKQDGSLDETNVLATAETDASGAYTTGSFIAPALYVVQAQAKTCADVATGTGCSYHQDEKKGARQYLPTGFSMRAVVTSATPGAQVNITPLSEMAVAAAARAAGGLTTANANQAMNMVNTLAGVGNVNAVVPKTLDAAGATQDETRVAALLTAVSGMASSGPALANAGCPAVTVGSPAATRCVVQALANNARLNNYVGANPVIAAALKTQLDAAVAGHAQAATLTASTGVKLLDPTASVPTTSLASAVDKTKAFFDDLTSTVRTLLDSGATPGQGAFLSQAHQFEKAVANLDFQSDVTASSAQLLYAAVRLWTEYEHGATATSTVIHKTLTSPDWFDEAGIKCTLQKANGNELSPGESASLVVRVACYADYTLERTQASPTGSFPVITYPYRNGYHWFNVTKGGTAGVFNYVATARWDDMAVTYDQTTGNLSIAIVSTNCPQSTNGTCGGARSFSGTVTTTLDSAFRLASAHVTGDLPDTWKDDTTLTHGAGAGNQARTHIDIVTSLTGTHVDGTLASHLASGTFAFSGGNVAYAADGGTEESSLSVASGSKLTIDEDTVQSSALDLVLLTPKARLAGALAVQRGANHGGTGSFAGALFNRDQSETVPFISASLQATVTGASGFDPDLPMSATNYLDGSFKLDAFITAPSHPKIRLIAAATGRQTQADMVWGSQTQDSGSGNYIIYNADGSTRRDVAFSLSDPQHDGHGRIAFNDAANGIAFTLSGDSDVADVLAGGLKVGEIDTGSARLTFTTGEFISLDFGTVLYSN